MRKKLNDFLEGVAYRLGQLQININCVKCYKELHLLQVEINQFLLIESHSHRKEYYRDLCFDKMPSKSEMVKGMEIRGKYMSEMYLKRTKKGKGRKKKQLIKDIDKMVSEMSPLGIGLLSAIFLNSLDNKEKENKDE